MRDQITIIVDSREKEEYSFDQERITILRRALPAGDYSLLGFEEKVAVERKSLSDFISTVIHDRERFYNELEKLKAYDSCCVVIEANLRDIFEGKYRSRAHPNSIVGSILSIIIDFEIPVYCCSDRQAACRFVQDYLIRFHQRILNRCKHNHQNKT